MIINFQLKLLDQNVEEIVIKFRVLKSKQITREEITSNGITIITIEEVDVITTTEEAMITIEKEEIPIIEEEEDIEEEVGIITIMKEEIMMIKIALLTVTKNSKLINS